MSFFKRKPPTKRLHRPAIDGGDMPAGKYELILWLDALYPAAFPSRGVGPEDWLRDAGARELIDELLELMHAEINPDIVEHSDASDPRALTKPRVARAL